MNENNNSGGAGCFILFICFVLACAEVIPAGAFVVILLFFLFFGA